MALPREDGGHAMAPGMLNGGQDAKLVVDKDVVIRRVAFFDVVQLQFLVNVNEHGTPKASYNPVRRIFCG
jgi:hypothetical protein